MNQTWAAAREELAGTLDKTDFDVWVDPLRPMAVEDQTLVLACPNSFFLAWVRDHYLERIQAALARVSATGQMAARVVRLDVSAVGGNERPEAKAGYRQAELPRLEAHHPGLLRFNPRFTFDRFVVGSGNQLAFAAAQAMASDAQLHTDALFIQSDPGLGKSHLSQAFSQHLLADDRRRRIYYLTAEDFTNELVYSLKNQSTEDFKNKYRRGCDVLVLEEIHFLSGKEKVQAELAYVLDILAENKKKVVFTGTRPPRDIPRLSRAFVSRLQSSLISSIDPPDYKTRMRILQMRAQEHGLAVDDQVFDFLAARLKRDIRQLESGLNGLMAKSQLLGRPLNLDLAQETLGDLVGPEDGCSAEAIQRMICRYFRLSVEDLKSKSRKKNIILPRNLGMYLCRQLTDLSLEAIGKWFGRNHSTVLYSVNLVESRQRRDPKLKAQVEFLVQQIKSGAKDF